MRANFAAISMVIGLLAGCGQDESSDTTSAREQQPPVADVVDPEPEFEAVVDETPVESSGETPVDFDSFASYRSLSDSDKEAVRETVITLVKVDPVWRRLEANLEIVDGSESLVTAIDEYCDGVEEWKPIFKEMYQQYREVVPGGQLDLIAQEICGSVMADPQTIMAALNEQIARYGTDTDVAAALERLDETLRTMTD